MPKISAVFFDYDGVLSTGRFYSIANNPHPQVREFVDEVIFKGEHKYADRWMRGELTHKDINKIVAEGTGIPFETIEELLCESVRQFPINDELIEFARELHAKGIDIALVTDNMDIFTEVTVPFGGFDKIFPVIVNSSDHKAMKEDQEHSLFDVAREQLGLPSFENVLLIDNSANACAKFESMGGQVHRFVGMDEFRIWREKNRVKFAAMSDS